MRVLVLSRGPNLYSTRRLVEAAEQRGDEVRVIDYLRCYMRLSANNPRVIFRGEELTDFDAVIPRIGASHTFYGTAVVRQFQEAGVYTTNTAVAISRSRDKLRSLQLLAGAGVSLPVTGFAHSTKDIDGLLGIVDGAPLIIKLLEGTQGMGVVLAETKKAAESVIGAFRQLDANILVQHFVKEAKGEDLRVLVVGGKIVASMLRRAKPGEFRSNVHQGGQTEPVKLTPAERATARKAAKVMGLNVAGVDMLRSENGPVVMEVNSSPGLEGIERASGVDVASKIMEFIEANAKPGRGRTRRD